MVASNQLLTLVLLLRGEQILGSESWEGNNVAKEPGDPFLLQKGAKLNSGHMSILTKNREPTANKWQGGSNGAALGRLELQEMERTKWAAEFQALADELDITQRGMNKELTVNDGGLSLERSTKGHHVDARERSAWAPNAKRFRAEEVDIDSPHLDPAASKRDIVPGDQHHTLQNEMNKDMCLRVCPFCRLVLSSGF